MTAPGVNEHGRTPGESEFTHGQGILPNSARGYQPDPVDMLRAIRQTDPTNPEADVMAAFEAKPSQGSMDELGVWTPGNLRNEATPFVTETGPSSTAGQHKRIDPSRPRGGDPEHYADGLQDGAGDAWRASLPPNPVTHDNGTPPVVSGP